MDPKLKKCTSCNGTGLVNSPLRYLGAWVKVEYGFTSVVKSKLVWCKSCQGTGVHHRIPGGKPCLLK